jgi:hypothetical protein
MPGTWLRRGCDRGVTVLGEKYRNKFRERFSGSSPLHLCQRRLGLWEPEGHVHGSIEVDSSGEFGAGLLPLVGGGIQHAQTAAAMGLERAHVEFLGQD